MTNDELARALIRARPGAAWLLAGTSTTVAELIWLDQVQVKPTQQEVDDALAQLNADAARLAVYDSAIAAATIGTLQPATVAQLKGMSNAEYGAWFDANFATAAQCIALLKALVRIVIRRVL